jgi:regulation of enolase protein 1 (concanavalin A-like superfamily)
MLKLAIALAVLLLAAPDAPLFEDRFDGKLADGWAWVREDKADWETRDGALRIRATPGNLWEAENTARNLLLRPRPKEAGAFAAEVTVTHAPVTFAEQAGLLWYTDDDNYVKLMKEFYDGKTFVVLAAEQSGKAVYRESACPAETVTFRLTVAGDEVVGQYRPDGAKEWTTVGRLPFKAGEGARVGVNAHHAPAGIERWASFRDFRLLGSR